jgi:hypothetical protein
MGRPHRTLFQPTMMGTVARSFCLPEATCPVKPDCVIREAARVMQTIMRPLGVKSAHQQHDLT